MLIPNQCVEVKITKRNIEHYKGFGYCVKLKDKILVPVEHLTTGAHIYVDIKCDYCNKLFKKLYKDYIKTKGNCCCSSCISVKARETIKEKYGANNTTEIPGVKEKMKQTCLERYGYENPSSSQEVKEKRKKTNLKNYGVEHAMQSKEIQEKARHTNLKRLGVEYPMQSDYVKDKSKCSFLEKYGVDNYTKTEEYKEKTRQSNLKNFGVEYASQSDYVKTKVKQTNKQKYGVEYVLQSDFFKNKAMETTLNRYGVDNYSKTNMYKEKVQKTNLERYGVKSFSSTNEYKEKVKQTCLERYGTESTLQVPEFREKALKTMAQNGTVPTSSQQISVYNIVKTKYNNTELNYPFSNCCLDIFVSVKNIKIDIEYDGWYWHQDKYKDIKRDKFLQKNGFKVLRIKSGNKLPTEEQLLGAINKLVETDYKYTEIILDDWREGEESV